MLRLDNCKLWWLFPFTIAALVHLAIHLDERKRCHIKGNVNTKTERESRQERGLIFRMQQIIASYLPSYGTRLRGEMYKELKSTARLSLLDMQRAGEGFTFENVNIDRHVTPLPLPKAKYDRFIALWIQDKKIEQLLFKYGKEAKDIILKYSPDIVCWNMPPADAYHVTLFHFSQFEEPFLHENVDGDDIEVMNWELKESSKIWETAGKYTLVAHDLVLTKSGTLLVLWHAKDGNVDWLRATFKNHFRNTPTGQTERILHSTLARFVVCPEENTSRLTSVFTDDTNMYHLKHDLRGIAAKVIGTEVTFETLLYAGCKNYYDCSRFRFNVSRDST